MDYSLLLSNGQTLKLNQADYDLVKGAAASGQRFAELNAGTSNPILVNTEQVVMVSGAVPL